MVWSYRHHEYMTHVRERELCCASSGLYPKSTRFYGSYTSLSQIGSIMDSRFTKDTEIANEGQAIRDLVQDGWQHIRAAFPFTSLILKPARGPSSTH